MSATWVSDSEAALPHADSGDRDAKSPAFNHSSRDLDGTVKTAQVELYDIFEGDENAVDPVYHAKARVLNAAFQEIGMGRYQVRYGSLPRCAMELNSTNDVCYDSGTCSSSAGLAGSRELRGPAMDCICALY